MAANELLKQGTVCGELVLRSKPLKELPPTCQKELLSRGGMDASVVLPSIIELIEQKVAAEMPVRERAEKSYLRELAQASIPARVLKVMTTSPPETDPTTVRLSYYRAMEEILKPGFRPPNHRELPPNHGLQCQPEDATITSATSCKVQPTKPGKGGNAR